MTASRIGLTLRRNFDKGREIMWMLLHACLSSTAIMRRCQTAEVLPNFRRYDDFKL